MVVFYFIASYTTDSVSGEVAVNRYKHNRHGGSQTCEILVFHFLYVDFMKKNTHVFMIYNIHNHIYFGLMKKEWDKLQKRV